MKNQQTFKQWLKGNYKNENHRYAELLNDAMADKGYPWKKGYEAQMYYLMGEGSSDDCLSCLRDAYFDYLTKGFS